MATVSVCIPTYNPNIEYIRLAIDSVIKQSVEDWQLFIIDGAKKTSPRLKKLVDEFDDNRVRYRFNDGDKSMAGNWNFAVDCAETEFVTLLHDDDIWEANYLAKMLKLAQENPFSAAYFCGASLIDHVGRSTMTVADKVKGILTPNKTVTHLNGDTGLSSLLSGCFIFCPTVLYRKSKLRKVQFSSHWKMVTDFQLYYDLLTRGNTISGTNAKLYRYRRHKNNQTALLTASLERFKEEVEFYRMVAESVDRGWTMSIAKSKKMTIIKLHLTYVLLKALLTFNFSLAKSVGSYLKKIIRDNK